jgi:hypothetical protein
MDRSADVFGSLLDVIDARLQEAPQPPADADDRDSERSRLAWLRLETDRAEVRLHSHVTTQPVTYGEASFCTECGEPAPCPTIRLMADRYELDY